MIHGLTRRTCRASGVSAPSKRHRTGRSFGFTSKANVPAKLELTGQRFGLLTAREYLGGKWMCSCDCGSESMVQTDRLRNGNTKSCGCLKRAVLGLSTVKHGKAGTRTHRIWKAMRNRCNNPNGPRYRDYGGRGIAVCERWNDFAKFISDMGEAPEGMSIDRWPNNDGDYEPSNCRWSTAKQQRATALNPYQRNPRVLPPRS